MLSFRQKMLDCIASKLNSCEEALAVLVCLCVLAHLAV